MDPYATKGIEPVATESMFSMNLITENQGEPSEKRVHYLPKMPHKPVMQTAKINKPILEQKREYEKKLQDFDREKEEMKKSGEQQ